MENNNDDARRIMFHKSNKYDAPKVILSTESRQWDLWHHQCKKGDNTQNENLSTRKVEPKKERAACCISKYFFGKDNDELCDEIPTLDYKKMTIVQLREIIKGKGFEVKNISKLKKKDLVALIEKS